METPMNLTRFIDIKKIDEDQRMVYGWASTGDLDSDGEIIEPSAFEKSLPSYLKFPTIREMHQPKPIGITKETRMDKNRGLFIAAKIVDSEAWMKVKEGVYRAFSIGGRVKERIDNIIKEIELIEISLVDVPANPAAVVTLFKGDKTDNVHLEFKQLANKIRSLMEEKEVITNDEELQVSEETSDENAENETIEATAEVTETKSENTEGQEAEAVEENAEESEAIEEVVEEKMQKSNDLINLEKAHEASVAKFDAVVNELSTKIESLQERLSQLENSPSEPKTKGSFVAVSEMDNSSDRATAIDKRLSELMEMREKDVAAYQRGGFQAEAMRLISEKKSL